VLHGGSLLLRTNEPESSRITGHSTFGESRVLTKFDPACGAGESIKPGVERSGTPG